MPSHGLIRRFHELAGFGPEVVPDADSLIGIFQSCRPDGQAIRGLFDELDSGPQLEARLGQLYQAAGDDRRPQGGRDAYFVVRNPPPLDPAQAERLANRWLVGVRELATAVGDTATAKILDPIPAIRVLEGIPPKHPKLDRERSKLLKTLQREAALWVERIDGGPHAATLRPAFYFTACDAMLRDYLMWPLYAPVAGTNDPLEPYFQLWRHGVKYRVFGETQVDLYLPRQLG